MQIKNSFKLGLLASALVLSQGVWALGLGKLTVHSPLGHPLKAQIELMGTKDEFSNLSANIASPTVYQSKDLVYQGALSGASVVVEQRPNGTAYLSISSSQPVNEPYLDLLIEVAWPSGHALREYTILLDPPDTRAMKPAPIVAANAGGIKDLPRPQPKPTAAPPASPQVATATTTQPSAVSSTAATPRQRPVAAPIPGTSQIRQPATSTVAEPSSPEQQRPEGNTYRVQSGDTLSKIALMYRPNNEITLQQALVALYEANPKAFGRGNMNILRAGAVINIPDAERFADVSPSEARQVVSIQTQEWRSYRESLVASVTTRPEATDSGAIGTVTRPAVVEQKDKPDSVLTISSATSGDGASPAGASNTKTTTASSDDAAAAARAAAEAAERARIEQEIAAKEQRRLELENQRLAEAQKQAEALAKAQEEARLKAEAEAAAAAARAKAEAEAAKLAAATQAQPSAPKPPEVQAPPQPQTQPTTPAPKPRPAPAPVEQPFSVVDWVMDNILAVGSGVLVLVLLVSFIIYRRRRNEEDSDSMFTEVTGTSSMTASSTSLSTRTGMSSSLSAAPRERGNSSTASAQSSNSILSEFSRDVDNMVTGEVDPLAEADVYLAYGRAQQAEEILLDALKKNGQRQDVYLKLLEVLADQKKVADFENFANRLFTLSGGRGEYWDRAKVLGQRLMPGNPRFADGGSTTAAPTAQAPQSVVIGGQEVDPHAFSSMETPSVAQSIARAASESVGRRAAGGEMTQSSLDSPSLLSEMSEVQFSLEPETSQNDELGVDLDLEELSRFRNFGKGEEHVEIDSGVSPTASRTDKGQMSSQDVSELDLNLGDIDEPKPTEGSGFASLTAETEGPWNDVATKLDLARAYQATGDAEACREILQEVLKEGDEQQKSEAQAILKSL